MKYPNLPFSRQRSLLKIVLMCFIASIAPSSWAKPLPWIDEPYAYIGRGEPLHEVLTNIGRQFGLEVNISARVNRKSPINGELNEASPGAMLDRLGSLYGFDWYVDAGTLFISQLDQRQRKVINVPPAVVGQLRQALMETGAYRDSFGWGELPNQGQIIVWGPPGYIARIDRLVDMLANTPSDQEVGVFHLKYANVEDRILNFRGDRTTIPGVVTLLRGVAQSGSLPTLQGDSATPGEPSADIRPAWARYHSTVSIEPDFRLNAVVIKASPSLLRFYKRLVEQLDTEVPLVQIEVAIIDLDDHGNRNLGLEWGINSSNSAVNVAIAGISTVLPQGINLNAKLNMLEDQGQGQVISKPTLLTMDNTVALFDSSETSYIRNAGERVVETIPVSVGLALKIKPRIVPTVDPRDWKVVLQLDIEDGKRVNATNEELPVLKNSSISTQAMIGDGQSLIIAGHKRDETQTNIRRVPGLGRIPLIGKLFTSQQDIRMERTRVFIITPRIIPNRALDLLREASIATPNAEERPRS